jgi:polysaccharide biosynthesis protein PslH
MRVLVVLSTAAYPKDVGKRIMIGGMCDYLKQSTAVTSVCFASFASRAADSADEEIVAMPRPSSRQKFRNLLWHTVLRGRKTIQESLFWNPSAQRKLDLLVQRFRPDVVLFDTMRVGQYGASNAISGLECRRIIYMDDLFSLRYERMLRAIKAHGLAGMDAMGNFAENVPGPLLRVYRKLPMVQKFALEMERRLVSASEDRTPANFDRALLVSSTEKEHLADRTKAQNIFSIPPRLDHNAQRKRAWHKRPEFVFLGSLNLAHNAISLETFLDNYMPDLRLRIPGIMITVVGKNASSNLKRLAELYAENVQLLGFVDDIDEVLLRCCAMISPLVFGSGVKLKALDALRCGIPLISTACGLEGVETGNSAGVLQGNLDAFPWMMLYILDPQRNAMGSRENAELYRAVYSRGAVDTIYERLLLDLNTSTERDVLEESELKAG